jgi:hypothetical protein
MSETTDESDGSGSGQIRNRNKSTSGDDTMNDADNIESESEELGSDAQVYIPFVSMKKKIFEEGKFLNKIENKIGFNL